MKKSILLASLLLTLTSTLSLAQGDDTKTLVRSLDPQNSTAVVLDFGFNAIAEEWKETTIRVLLDVKLENGNDNLLKQLIQVGRYNVEGKKEGDKFVISIPSFKKEVTVKGQKLNEIVTAQILTPDGIVFTNVAGEEVKVESLFMKEMAAKGLAVKALPPFREPFNCEVRFTSNGNADETYTTGDILIDGQALEIK